MWDGSFRASRQVSMRGKSAREEGRKALTARVKQDRERRKREKDEIAAQAVLKRVLYSYQVRQNEKRAAIAEWSSKVHDIRGVEAAVRGFVVPMPILIRLVNLFVFGYDDSREDVCGKDMLNFCKWVAKAQDAPESADALVSNTRVLALCSLLMNYLQLTLRDNLSAYQRKGVDESELVHTIVVTLSRILEQSSNIRVISVSLISTRHRPHRCAGSVSSVLHSLINIRKLHRRTEELSLVQLFCSMFAEYVEQIQLDEKMRSSASYDNDVDVQEQSELELVMHEFACSVLSIDGDLLQKYGVDEILREKFSAKAWAAALRGLGSIVDSKSSEDNHVVANSIRISRACADKGEGRDDLRAAFWRSIAYMLQSSQHGHILETLPELKQLRDPGMVQHEFYSVLDPGADGASQPNFDLLLAVCSAYEVIRKYWTHSRISAAVNSQGSNVNALDTLSASGVVIGAVAFSPHDRSLVRMLWSTLVDFLDEDGFISPSLFSEGRLKEVCSVVTFTCAATCQLLPALDDEEIFVNGVPLSVELLRLVALFLKHVLYEGLWEQKDTSVPSKQDFPDEMMKKCAELYDQLYDRHSRHPIMDDSQWLFPEIREDELGIAGSGVVRQTASLSRIPRLVNILNTRSAWDESQTLKRPERLGASARRRASAARRRGMSYDESNRMSDDSSEDEDSRMEDAVQEGVSPENASDRVKNLLRALPEAVPFDQRTKVFDHFLRSDRHSVSARTRYDNFTRLTVRRGTVYDDAFEALHEKASLKGRIQVQFMSQQGIAERGIDGGGLFKEFLLEFMKEAFDPNNGLWKISANQELYPNPDSSLATGSSLHHYQFIGRMLGKAVYEGILLELRLAPFFLNSILGHRNHLHDLQSLDPEIYRNVIHLKSLSDPGEVGLTFSVSRQCGSKTVDFDLVPGGSNIEVTKDNYVHYISRLSSFRLNEEFRPQTEAFLTGFSSLISLKWIQMFKPREMQLVIGGSDDGFDVQKMRLACTYSHGYHPSQPYIQAFWEVVSEMDAEERGLLLRFITSCSKPPLQGFGSLHPPLCIACVNIENDGDRLPTASTCVNFLKLPKYSSKEVLQEKLLFAIKSASGFELS